MQKHHPACRTAHRRAPKTPCACFRESPAFAEPSPRDYEWPFMVADALVTSLARGIARLTGAAARALHRAYCVRRETREASLLGIPTPADLEAAWVPPRRTLRQTLVIGSKLVDLTPTHSDALKWSAPDAGARRKIAGREGGLKRYLAQSCPSVRYTTAMRYRKLAQRLRQYLDLPAPIPLEWLLCDTAPDALAADSSLAETILSSRRRLSALLADIRTQRALSRHLDRQLGGDRLPFSLRGKNALQDAALRDEILTRCEARLAAALASGRELTPEEKKALKLLQKLRRLTAQLAPGK